MLAPAQQSRLERGISAPTVSAEAAVVATQVRASLLSRGRSLLSPGSVLRIDRPSFHVVTADTAIVNAVVTGPVPGRWQLLLIHEAGQWLLMGTRKLP